MKLISTFLIVLSATCALEKDYNTAIWVMLVSISLNTHLLCLEKDIQ